MTKYTDLIAKLEACAGADRELDRAIAEEVLGMITEWLAPVNSPVMVLCFMPYRREGAQPPAHMEVPAYTASLDAAMTLVPEGWRWDSLERDVSWNEHESTDQSFGVSVDLRDADGRWIRNAVGSHDLLPIALCIASLRARESTT